MGQNEGTQSTAGEISCETALRSSSPLPDEAQLLPELYVTSRLEVKL